MVRHGQVPHGGRAGLVQAVSDPRDGPLYAGQVASTLPLAQPSGRDQGSDQVADLTGEGGFAELIGATSCPGAAAGNVLGDHLGCPSSDGAVGGGHVVTGAVIRVGGQSLQEPGEVLSPDPRYSRVLDDRRVCQSPLDPSVGALPAISGCCVREQGQ